MSYVSALRDGETLPHTELMVMFGFKTARAFKDRVADLDIPYYAEQGVWWIAVEDYRKAMRLRAKTHKERQEEKQEKAPV